MGQGLAVTLMNLAKRQNTSLLLDEQPVDTGPVIVGQGGFITSIHDAVDTCYRDVLQNLQPWTPPADAHDAAATKGQPDATDGPTVIAGQA